MKSTLISIRTVCLVLFIVAISKIAFAQEPPPPPPDPTIPIDGGISLLIAAGIGYGAKKIYGSRKR